jgi:hypothetical protein
MAFFVQSCFFRLHKEEFGDDLFPKVMDVIIDHIAAGLVKDRG